VTDEVLTEYMTPRPLLYRGIPSNTILSASGSKTGVSRGPTKDLNSKTQLKKKKKLEAANFKKVQKAQSKMGVATTTAGIANLSVTECKVVDKGQLS
jgi:tryptophanyl-tRNA synthetase